MKWVGYVACMGKRESPQRERPHGRPRYKWEDNIKLYLGEIGYDDVELKQLAPSNFRGWVFVTAVMKL
jgi:hypothetical protein